MEVGDIRIHKRGVTLTHRYHETVGHYFPPMMGRDSRNILYVVCLTTRARRR